MFLLSLGKRHGRRSSSCRDEQSVAHLAFEMRLARVRRVKRIMPVAAHVVSCAPAAIDPLLQFDRID
jgi:hypothetical protein